MLNYLYWGVPTFCPASEDIAKVYNSIGGVVVGDVRRSSLPERHLGNVLAHPGGKRLGGAQKKFYIFTYPCTSSAHSNIFKC